MGEGIAPGDQERVEPVNLVCRDGVRKPEPAVRGDRPTVDRDQHHAIGGIARGRVDGATEDLRRACHVEQGDVGKDQDADGADHGRNCGKEVRSDMARVYRSS